jgi:hypothetical protein
MSNKKETTLEEFAEKLARAFDNDNYKALMDLVIDGAKWQAERMYSEEDLKHLEWIYDRIVNVHNENPNYDYMLKFKSIIEQFKKK